VILQKPFSVPRGAAAGRGMTISALCQFVTRRVRRRSPALGAFLNVSGARQFRSLVPEGAQLIVDVSRRPSD
jgi:hypothetical protein